MLISGWVYEMVARVGSGQIKVTHDQLWNMHVVDRKYA